MKKKINVAKIWFLILFLLIATYLVITVYQIVSYQNGTKTEAVDIKAETVTADRLKSLLESSAGGETGFFIYDGGKDERGLSLCLPQERLYYFDLENEYG